MKVTGSPKEDGEGGSELRVRLPVPRVARSTWIVRFRLALCGFLIPAPVSRTVTAAVNSPVTWGIPLMVPVDGDNDKPGGKDPESRLQS